MNSETAGDFKIKVVGVLTELPGRRHGQHIATAIPFLSWLLPQGTRLALSHCGKKFQGRKVEGGPGPEASDNPSLISWRVSLPEVSLRDNFEVTLLR